MGKILHTKPVKAGKGSPIPCSIEALRLVPMGYTYPSDWVDYVNSMMEERMKRILDETQADDMCDNMFDSDIDTAAQSPRADAARQHTIHRQVLRDRKRRLSGEIDARNDYRKNLLARLAEVEADITRCEEAEQAD